MNTPQVALSMLRLMLEDAKNAERRATDERRAIEAAILQHPDVTAILKAEGTTTVGGISIQTGYTREWDSLRVADFAHDIDPAWFPFRVEYKEDRRKTKAIQDMAPDLWDKLQTALTLKPKKAQVSIKEDK